MDYRKLFSWLCPRPNCPLCKSIKENDRILCARCRKALHNYKSFGYRYTGDFPLITAAPYSRPFSLAVQRFKYQKQTHLSSVLSHLMLEAYLYHSQVFSVTPELITWIPGERVRSGRRGFNPSAILAAQLSRSLLIPRKCLLERKAAPAQAGLSGEQRKFNLEGRFKAAVPGLAEGKKILLVDDVATTGATLQEAVRALKQEKAEKIVCIVFAGSAV